MKHLIEPDLHALEKLLSRSGHSRNTIASRCGYTALDKGRRRLAALADGDLTLYPQMREALAAALGVSLEELDAAAEAVRAHHRGEKRRQFVPHIVWQTERHRPSQVALAAVTGAADLRRRVPQSSNPIHMHAEAVASCPDQIPFFGKVVGFHLNYSLDSSASFDRHGNPLALNDHAISTGHGSGQAAALARLLR